MHLQLVGPERTTHDFSRSRFCMVPLTLWVRNTLAAPAAVCVETGRLADGQPAPVATPTWAPQAGSQAGGGASAAQGAAPSSSSGGSSAVDVAASAVAPARAYLWCGATRLTLPSVPGHTTLEVPLRVAALVPGSLALADYTVSWSYAEAPQLAGSRQGPPCFVTVQQQPPQPALS